MKGDHKQYIVSKRKFKLETGHIKPGTTMYLKCDIQSVNIYHYKSWQSENIIKAVICPHNSHTYTEGSVELKVGEIFNVTLVTSRFEMKGQC